MSDEYEDLRGQCMNDPFWAADEIERLRAANQEWCDKWDRLQCEWCGTLGLTDARADS